MPQVAFLFRCFDAWLRANSPKQPTEHQEGFPFVRLTFSPNISGIYGSNSQENSRMEVQLAKDASEAFISLPCAIREILYIHACTCTPRHGERAYRKRMFGGGEYTIPSSESIIAVLAARRRGWRRGKRGIYQRVGVYVATNCRVNIHAIRGWPLSHPRASPFRPTTTSRNSRFQPPTTILPEPLVLSILSRIPGVLLAIFIMRSSIYYISIICYTGCPVASITPLVGE